MKSGKLKERVSASLLMIPISAAFASILLSLLAGWLDEVFAHSGWAKLLFRGGPDSARSILSTIAASMVTFLGVVFSITMVVLQLASNRFSPRVLRTFLKDRTSQATLGVFVATFTFSLAALRGVRPAGSSAVPIVSATVAFALVVASLVTFVAYVNHMARAIRISRIAAAIGDETADVIERHHGNEQELERFDYMASISSQPSRTISAENGGNIDAINATRLADLAADADVLLLLEAQLGQFVPRGAPLIAVHGDGELDDERVLAQVDLAEERTMTQDPAFGFRQLVDIAERSLSPGTIDPTSAVQALDQIHDLLRDLAGRDLPPHRAARDVEGRPRVVIPSMTWDEYLDLAVDEIVLYGQGSIQVSARLRAMLHDLEKVTSGERWQAVRKKVDALPPRPDPYGGSEG